MMVLAVFGFTAESSAEAPREIIAKALVSEDSEEQCKLVQSLAGNADPSIQTLLTAWKEGVIYIFEAPEELPGFTKGQKLAITLLEPKDPAGKQEALRFDTNQPLKDAAGKTLALLASDLSAAETDSTLRLSMKGVLDSFALAAESPSERLKVVSQFGLAQDPAQLSALQARQKIDTDSRVQRALKEAIAQIELKSEDPKTQIAAAQTLGELGSIPSQDALKSLLREFEADQTNPVAIAASAALQAIQSHVRWVNGYGTAFRGLSTGSVLLIAAIGLAITFGLMGIINMAHGELIAVGAYTTYVVQKVFDTGLTVSPFGHKISLPGMHTSGALFDCYFLVAIPLAFLSAALVGIVLERCVIRFLYRRPLESLLATWGVSLILQQLFKFVFGANNVQVDAPSWLAGKWSICDVDLLWNRVFVISFAVLIVLGVRTILTKTSLGLLIRAVMQNRAMAACVGVRTQRVNMLTFALGSGLAGLAGAFLSQLGNVGPGLGEDYIVSAFMTVVVGGVGNLAGTVISALGIGIADQTLQQILLNPVLGKILVLGGIILFLQWRPAGIFVTKTRSLED